jgi:hypothetical protein
VCLGLHPEEYEQPCGQCDVGRALVLKYGHNLRIVRLPAPANTGFSRMALAWLGETVGRLRLTE